MTPIISREHQRVMVPVMPGITEKIDQLIPGTLPMNFNGTDYKVIPHGPDETRLLRNMGLDVPAPILWHYNWPGRKPFEAQRTTAAMLTTNRRAYVLNSMGTGKTLATLWAADHLMRAGLVRRALVVAPLSILTTVWENEIFRNIGGRTVAVVHHASRAGRLKRLQIALDTNADFIIVNHDGIKVMMDELMALDDIDLVVIDELAVFRNKATKLFKNMKKLVADRPYVWGLTGQPTPNAPTDAWAQVKLLTPGRVPGFFKHFQNTTMVQVSKFQWVPKRGANEVVHHAMQPAVRFTREDCFDLPPVTTSLRDVAMTPDQKKAYKAMFDHFRTEFNDGEITAANEGVKRSKLLQICAGFAYDRHSNAYDLGCGPRVKEVLDILDETSRKVIVFASFTHAVETLGAELAQHVATSIVHGGTSPRERTEIFNMFEATATPRVIVAHPKCMAHGLTLVAANTIVWFTPPPSFEIWDQANKRITRAGQKHSQHVVFLSGSNLETKIFKNLGNNTAFTGILMAMFTEGVKY